MTAIDASYMRGLIEMAGETNAIGLRGRQFGGVADVGRVHGFGMLAAGAVAGLAGFGFEASFLVVSTS